MEKIKLTKIYTTDKDKQGNPLKSQKGYPYTRMSIKCEQYGDKWLSGFQNADNKDWKEGDEVEITKTENTKDGKTYLNFNTPKKDDKVVEMLSQLLTKVGLINAKIDYLQEKIYPREKALNEQTPKNDVLDEVEYPTEDIRLEDVGF